MFRSRSRHLLTLLAVIGLTAAGLATAGSATATTPTGTFSVENLGALTIKVTAQMSPTGGTTYLWKWGDAQASGSGTVANHPYAQAGVYTVTLTATNAGDSTTQQQLVWVTAAAPAVTVSHYSATVSWSLGLNKSGVTQVEVHRGSNAGFVPSAATAVATGLSPSVTSWTDTAHSGTWYYKVVLKDGSGNAVSSDASAAAVVTRPTADAGAHSVSYADPPSGKVYYVSMGGSDSYDGTFGTPFRTLAKAVSQVKVDKACGSATIVVRGSTTSYHEGNVTIGANCAITIQPYRGESVWFDGASTVTGFKLVPGSSSVYMLTNFTSRTPTIVDTFHLNCTPGDAKCTRPTTPDTAFSADQVWIDGKHQVEVGDLSLVKDGTFYVNRTDKILYIGRLPSSASPGVEVSDLAQFLNINGNGSKVLGIGVKRFGDNHGDYGVISVRDAGQEITDVTLQGVQIDESANIAVHAGNGDKIVKGVKLKDVSITNSGWMGVHASYNDDLLLDHVRITGSNRDGQFFHSPMSGGLKATKSWRTIVRDSVFSGNKSPGVWFDQQCYDTQIVGNDFLDNRGHGVYYEISDLATIANNRINAGSAPGKFGVKISGSSRVTVENNTIVGGAAPLALVDDTRRPGAPDTDPTDLDKLRPNNPLYAYPSEMNWIVSSPSVKNNAFGYPDTSSKGDYQISAVFAVQAPPNTGATSVVAAANVNGNAYQRQSANTPSTLVWWGDANTTYHVLKDFRTLVTNAELTGKASDNDGSVPIYATAPSDATSTPEVTAALRALDNSAVTHGAWSTYLPPSLRFRGAWE